MKNNVKRIYEKHLSSVVGNKKHPISKSCYYWLTHGHFCIFVLLF